VMDFLLQKFEALIQPLVGNESELIDFGHHVQEIISQMIEESKSKIHRERESVLESIIQDLRKKVPPSAEAPSEKITFPNNKDFEASNTAHVDSFLYGTDDDVDELCKMGSLNRNYCQDCGSRNVIPLNFISHSASKEQLHFIFGKEVFPDLTGKIVVDVGSRLGNVLYMGYLFSNAAQLIGVERNTYFCDVQQYIIERYRMQDRIKIVEADIITQGELLSKADVLILNNVFEFFVEEHEQKVIWEFLGQSMSKGSLIVSIPSLSEALSNFKTSFDIDKWVEEIPLNYGDEDDLELIENLEQIHLYKIR